MKMTIIPTIAVLLVGLALQVFAEQPKKELSAMEQKMVGVWKGGGGCEGNIVLRADGTYKLTDFGPAPTDSAGTWKVQSDVVPAILVLTCKTSAISDDVGTTTKAKLNKLDDGILELDYESHIVGCYKRVKK
jgi:hypothetical protein